MKRNVPKTSKRLQKEQLDIAMKDFYSKGGRVKKIKGVDMSCIGSDDDMEFDYSWMESSNSISLRKSRF